MHAPTDQGYAFIKAHGTENDFVLLPDPDGEVHGDLSEQDWVRRVVALADRRAGIGGDGVIRVVRTAVLAQSDAAAARVAAEDPAAEWFMDYRNSDGSLSEMCGNGVRAFGRVLLAEGLVAPGTAAVAIGTRAGVRTLRVAAERPDWMSVDMGVAEVLGRTEVSVADDGRRSWPAQHVDMGNPHAVARVAALDEAGDLRSEPAYDAGVYPHGVNVEFVAPVGPRHVAMRVHERGSGETRSCGTGACAAMVASALVDGAVADGGLPAEDVRYRVDVPGGELAVTWHPDGRVTLSGPAVIVARGTASV